MFFPPSQLNISMISLHQDIHKFLQCPFHCFHYFQISINAEFTRIQMEMICCSACYSRYHTCASNLNWQPHSPHWLWHKFGQKMWFILLLSKYIVFKNPCFFVVYFSLKKWWYVFSLRVNIGHISWITLFWLLHSNGISNHQRSITCTKYESLSWLLADTACKMHASTRTGP